MNLVSLNEPNSLAAKFGIWFLISLFFIENKQTDKKNGKIL